MAAGDATLVARVAVGLSRLAAGLPVLLCLSHAGRTPLRVALEDADGASRPASAAASSSGGCGVMVTIRAVTKRG